MQAIENLISWNKILELRMALQFMKKITGEMKDNPSKEKLQKLRKNSKVLTQKILDLHGGKEALIGIGFREDVDYFVFDASVHELPSLFDILYVHISEFLSYILYIIYLTEIGLLLGLQTRPFDFLEGN